MIKPIEIAQIAEDLALELGIEWLEEGYVGIIQIDIEEVLGE